MNKKLFEHTKLNLERTTQNLITQDSELGLTVTNGNHLEKLGYSTESNMSLIQLFEKAEPAVIQVNVKKIPNENIDGDTPGGVGSGFVYDENGHVITNHHVIDDALKITVTFLDGESYAAEIVGSDADLDLAVEFACMLIKMSPSTLLAICVLCHSGTKTSSSRVYTTLIPVFFSNKRPTR